jgi:hypothetical protein
LIEIWVSTSLDLAPVLLAGTWARASLLWRTVLHRYQIELLHESKADGIHPLFHPSLMLHPTLSPFVPTRSWAVTEEQSTLIPEDDYFKIQTSLFQRHDASTIKHSIEIRMNNNDTACKTQNPIRITLAALQPMLVSNNVQKSTAPF